MLKSVISINLLLNHKEKRKLFTEAIIKFNTFFNCSNKTEKVVHDFGSGPESGWKYNRFRSPFNSSGYIIQIPV